MLISFFCPEVMTAIVLFCVAVFVSAVVVVVAIGVGLPGMVPSLFYLL